MDVDVDAGGKEAAEVRAWATAGAWMAELVDAPAVRMPKEGGRPAGVAP